MGVLKGICVSKKRGTKKVEVAEAMLVENYGIEGDAHAGNWHRQVSLLSLGKKLRHSERKVLRFPLETLVKI